MQKINIAFAKDFAPLICTLDCVDIWFTLIWVSANVYVKQISLKGGVSDPGVFYPDTDSTFEEKLDPDPTFEKKSGSDP